MKWWGILLIVWVAVNAVYLLLSLRLGVQREKTGMKYNEWTDEWYKPLEDEEDNDGI